MLYQIFDGGAARSGLRTCGSDVVVKSPQQQQVEVAWEKLALTARLVTFFTYFSGFRKLWYLCMYITVGLRSRIINLGKTLRF
jgi:hypothetical protein